MAGIEDKLKNVRTLEDIINVLNVLYSSLNSLNRNYYDLFVNTTPRNDIEVMGYDDDGNIVPMTVANLAYYKTPVKTGTVNPNGVESGGIGTFYINTTTNHLFFKAEDPTGEGTSTEGWQELCSPLANFLENDGIGSSLRDLNADAITMGTLTVAHGGTGANSLSGIIKGNGTNPVSSAVEGVDYISPNNLRGTCSHFAGYIEDVDSGEEKELLNGWLVCNGAEVDKSKYSALYNVIGDRYGTASEGKFKLPNLIESYIKGGAVNESGENPVVSAIVGGHTHGLTGNTGSGGNIITGTAGEHSHGKGTFRIVGGFNANELHDSAIGKRGGNYAWGCFNNTSIMTIGSSEFGVKRPTPKAESDESQAGFSIDTNNVLGKDNAGNMNNTPCWTGNTSVDPGHTHSLNLAVANNTPSNPNTENDVKHLVMVPIIKY